MKPLFSFLIVIFLSLTLRAQMPAGGERGGGTKTGAAASGHLYGKLVDAAGKGIGDASVLLLQSRFDSASHTTKDVLLKGVTSQSNGDFSFEDLPVRGALKLKISATSYKAYEQKVSFASGQGKAAATTSGTKISAGPAAPEKDLGKITLGEDQQQLQDVVVTAPSGRLKMDIDKKVFSVDKNIVSTGGTAADVLKNVPSVNVDIDGNVTMRNAAPQIFVDGRPTILTLDQIPSDAIESVEVMTNPSARYDASGGGAGILNIVLKKNRKTGYNGNLRAGIDKLGGINSGFDFNYRENKINVSGSINYNQRKSNTTGSVSRTNLLDSPMTTISQSIQDRSTGQSLFAKAGVDYFMTNRTTLSLTGFKASGTSTPYQTLEIMTDSLFGTGTASSYRNRITTGNRQFNNQGLTFGVKSLFPKAGEEWTADVNYFSGNNSNNSLYTTNYFAGGSKSELASSGLQKIIGSGKDYNLVMQTDYVNPLSEHTKLETGLRAAVRGRENYNSNYQFDALTGNYTVVPSTSSNYTSTDKVFAAYASLTSTIGNFGYKLGLRAESSSYSGELTQTGQAFSNQYPISLFPSVFLSQKLGNNQEIQASFTRRINRPNFFQLIPFADYSDELNITQGNPALRPEFTNSMEATYSNNFSKNNTVMASIYYKKTDDLITSYLQPGTNPFTGQAAIINTFVNANSSQTYGLELTSQNTISPWWDMTANLNFYNGKINTTDQSVVSGGLWSYFGKWNNNFKLPSNVTVQLSGSYQAKTQLLASSGQGGQGGQGGGQGGGGNGFGIAQSASQGYIAPFYSVDIAVKKTFLKNNAAAATLSVSDLFRTRTVTQYSQSNYFIQDYSRLRDPQMVRLTLSYKFGKVDASLFKRKNSHTESDAGQAM